MRRVRTDLYEVGDMVKFDKERVGEVFPARGIDTEREYRVVDIHGAQGKYQDTGHTQLLTIDPPVDHLDGGYWSGVFFHPVR